LNENRQQQVVSLCRGLVRERSYSGEEQGVAALLAEFYRAQGFDSIQTDGYGNLIACVKGVRPGPKVLFDGHMDTVPVGNLSDWRYDPFAAELAEGRIYGRGASDMKGALSAMACAAAFYAADCGRDFPGEIYVVGSVHEECFEGVSSRSVSGIVKPDYVVIGESSQLRLRIGQRGRAEIVVETFGRPAHSSNPDKGVNAVYNMAEAVRRLRKLPTVSHPALGSGILELTDIISRPYPGASVVPEYCRATYDRRLLVGETEESVLAPIRRLLGEMAAEDPRFRAQASFASGSEKCYTGADIVARRFFPGWLYDAEAPFVKAVCQELAAIGHQPETGCYAFCTNGSHYAGEQGIPTIGLGPSMENIAHTADEYIEVSQLTGAVECYMGIMRALLWQPKEEAICVS